MTKVQSYFKDYPASNQCFETADGILFHQEGDANYHQTGTLKNNEPVKKHYRTSVSNTEATSAEPGEGDKVAKAVKKAAPKKAATKTATDAKTAASAKEEEPAK